MNLVTQVCLPPHDHLDRQNNSIGSAVPPIDSSTRVSDAACDLPPTPGSQTVTSESTMDNEDNSIKSNNDGLQVRRRD